MAKLSLTLRKDYLPHPQITAKNPCRGARLSPGPICARPFSTRNRKHGVCQLRVRRNGGLWRGWVCCPVQSRPTGCTAAEDCSCLILHLRSSAWSAGKGLFLLPLSRCSWRSPRLLQSPFPGSTQRRQGWQPMGEAGPAFCFRPRHASFTKYGLWRSRRRSSSLA